MHKSVLIIQARMSSARLPGKVLRMMCGKPMLEYLLDRASQINADSKIVATSEHESDDQVFEFCQRVGFDCYRGSLQDVAGRYREVIEGEQADFFIRVCGDSPLIDVNLVNQVIDNYLKSDCDLATNVYPRSYPPGQSVEVVRASRFLENVQKFGSKDQEHVTQYFYRNATNFRIRNLQSTRNFGTLHLAVDTIEDFEFCESIMAKLPDPKSKCGLHEIMCVLESWESKLA